MLDVDNHERTKWVVQKEGKGLDFVLEVLFMGDEGKDDSRGVKFYAELGIHEYFVFDRRRLIPKGYALPSPDARTYRPLLAQVGRFSSRILGLELALEGIKLRFYYGGASLPEADEPIARLEGSLSALLCSGRTRAAAR